MSAASRRPGAIDWSVPHYCEGCQRRIRPTRIKLADMPGTVPVSKHGLCKACSARGVIAKPAPKVRRNPTVAELAAAGHPCVSPAPMPSHARTFPL